MSSTTPPLLGLTPNQKTLMRFLASLPNGRASVREAAEQLGWDEAKVNRATALGLVHSGYVRYISRSVDGKWSNDLIITDAGRKEISQTNN